MPFVERHVRKLFRGFCSEGEFFTDRISIHNAGDIICSLCQLVYRCLDGCALDSGLERNPFFCRCFLVLNDRFSFSFEYGIDVCTVTPCVDRCHFKFNYLMECSKLPFCKLMSVFDSELPCNHTIKRHREFHLVSGRSLKSVNRNETESRVDLRALSLKLHLGEAYCLEVIVFREIGQDALLFNIIFSLDHIIALDISVDRLLGLDGPLI